MAKKRATTEKKNREKMSQIDHIPKYTQHPRSPPPKRRTDFSLFISSAYYSSPSNSGSLLGSNCCGEGLSSITMSSLDDGEKLHEVPLAQCSESHSKGPGLFSKFFEVPSQKAESVAQNALIDHCDDRNVGNKTNDNVGILEYTPKKSQYTQRNGVCITPGNVVWAKTACETWWPAEIIEERSSSADSAIQGIDGHVLVQFFGNHQSAWVDPASNLSELEDCFDERCCNSLENFQAALKQAVLQRKEHISTCQQFSESPNTSNHPDKWTSSVSSGVRSHLSQRERSKRERKPKIRFDEVTFPVKSTKKVRRLKIMRYLGLTAPLGSPF